MDRCENCGGRGVVPADCGHAECDSALQPPSYGCTVTCGECNGTGEISDAAPEGIIVRDLRLVDADVDMEAA